MTFDEIKVGEFNFDAFEHLRRDIVTAAGIPPHLVFRPRADVVSVSDDMCAYYERIVTQCVDRVRLIIARIATTGGAKEFAGRVLRGGIDDSRRC
jgi:hypothetical protein